MPPKPSSSSSPSGVYNEERLLERAGLGQNVETDDDVTRVRDGGVLEVLVPLTASLQKQKKKLVQWGSDAKEKRKDIVDATVSACRDVLRHFVSGSEAVASASQDAARALKGSSASQDDPYARRLMRAYLLCEDVQKQRLLFALLCIPNNKAKLRALAKEEAERILTERNPNEEWSRALSQARRRRGARAAGECHEHQHDDHHHLVFRARDHHARRPPAQGPQKVLASRGSPERCKAHFGTTERHDRRHHQHDHGHDGDPALVHGGVLVVVQRTAFHPTPSGLGRVGRRRLFGRRRAYTSTLPAAARKASEGAA
jgi:hypothetical protein